MSAPCFPNTSRAASSRSSTDLCAWARCIAHRDGGGHGRREGSHESERKRKRRIPKIAPRRGRRGTHRPMGPATVRIASKPGHVPVTQTAEMSIHGETNRRTSSAERTQVHGGIASGRTLDTSHADTVPARLERVDSAKRRGDPGRNRTCQPAGWWFWRTSSAAGAATA